MNSTTIYIIIIITNNKNHVYITKIISIYNNTGMYKYKQRT